MPLVGKATVNNDILNEFITETILNLSKTCAAKASNKINISAGDVGGNVVISGSVTQNAATDLQCENKNDLQAALKSEMANTIKQTASSKDSSVITGDFGLYSESTTNNKIINRNIIKTTLDDVMNCLSEATNEYTLTFGNIQGDFTFDQPVDQNAKAQVSKCVQNTGWSQQVSAGIANDVDQQAQNKGTLDSLFDGMGRIVGSIVAVVLVLGVCFAAAYVIYQIVSRNKKKDGVVADIVDSVSEMAKDAEKTTSL